MTKAQALMHPEDVAQAVAASVMRRLLPHQHRVIGGPEIPDGKTADPTLTVPEVETMVRFVNRAQVDAWGKANASEPATTMHFAGGERAVLQTYGQLIGQMPKVEPSDDSEEE